MTGEAITEETLQASLHDIRLPSEAPGSFAAELAATLALACLGALVLGAGMRLATVRARPPDPQSDLARIATLPDDARRVALLTLLKTHAPDRFEALKQSLYRPEPLDLAELQDEVARHV
ncbi:hypothetical protein [Sagittula sp. MA-2]|jgi:hypothetical protein|uniref:hypothetical protein n=1 Tax=Sagittula sp. MA-2 TaxID=3048007 RepID=UPI0024C36514|nr:hypothetical protein [Sagittula sp. MA-2]WHZ37800.1 hypothetical protein QNI11_23435 [Sagittula sp. MA-2]